MINKNQLLSKIEKYYHELSHHLFLNKWIANSCITQAWKQALISILQRSSLSEEKKIQYGAVLLLIQQSLNLHDTIDVKTPQEGDELFRSHQLTVLGGDYFSGLFYRELAKSGEVSLIKVLATSIREINEQKVTFHHTNHIEIKEKLQELQTIEGNLLRSLENFLSVHVLNEQDWNELVRQRLQIERTLFAHDQSQSSILFSLMQHSEEHKGWTKDKWEREIHETIQFLAAGS